MKFAPTFSTLCVAIAVAIGIASGGATTKYGHAVRRVLESPSASSNHIRRDQEETIHKNPRHLPWTDELSVWADNMLYWWMTSGRGSGLGLGSDPKVDQAECDAWKAKESQQPAFVNELINCPCNQEFPGNPPGGFRGLGSARQQYHPGASHCMNGDTCDCNSAAGQQCCYDSNNRLITGGLGAGTPDRYTPVACCNNSLHTKWDVLPYSFCSCVDYLALRPPNNGNGCDTNIVNDCTAGST